MPHVRFTQKARRLRERQTPAEAILWTELRDRRLGGLKFRRQAPRGTYIVDFYCAESKLVVGLDGGVHRIPEVAAADLVRTEWLERQGYVVLRFSNAEVLNRVDRVCAAILAAACGQAPHPSLSP
ncbi:MAG TPA: endonuclease domain-containing protein [Caulobacteraceae bacterium]|nr:endonuclease domain-containing protein [Caulobacteraceae bacterium]